MQNFPYLPKDRSLKRNSIVINFLSRSFINQGKLTLITEEKTGSQSILHPGKLGHKLPFLPSIF